MLPIIVLYYSVIYFFVFFFVLNYRLFTVPDEIRDGFDFTLSKSILYLKESGQAVKQGRYVPNCQRCASI